MGTICWKSQDVNPTIAGFSAEIHAGLDGYPFFYSAGAPTAWVCTVLQPA